MNSQEINIERYHESILDSLKENKINDVIEAPNVRPRQSMEDKNKANIVLFFFMVFFP